MKKVLAITMALILCVCFLAIGTVAANYSYVTVTGTMNGWNPASEADRMTQTGDGLYTITYENMAAGNYEFKFTANGNWSDLDLGGAFMGSGVESSLSWGGSNIKFTLEEAANVSIDLDINNYKFVLTINGQTDEAPEEMVLHITVPASWSATYVYVWGPESLGSWPGTAVIDGQLSLLPVFDGMVISNGNGSQSRDITDIDKTQPEAWITVYDDGSYSVSYEEPGHEEEPPAADMKIHVLVPDAWETAYVYTFNPEQCGSWPGMAVENGMIEIPASFEGLIVNNGNGAQTADIRDIDMTAAEVWIVVAEDCSYALFYNEADVVLPTPIANIKINVTAAHWANIYAYTYNPEQTGSWPGTLLENGAIVLPAAFEGLVLSDGEGQQTADIKDIDLTQEEVWITVNADNSYTISYEAPVVDPVGPETGDGILPGVLVLLLSVGGIALITTKKDT